MPRSPSHQNGAEISDGSQPRTDLAALVQAANQRTSLLAKLDRAAHVLRYYRTSQLLRRAARVAWPSFSNRAIKSLPTDEAITMREGALDKLRSITATRIVKDSIRSNKLCEDLSVGKLTLLNQSQELGNPIDWLAQEKPHPSRLWSFQLHYHEYLLDLASSDPAERDDRWATIWRIVADWISGNPPGESSLTGNAWHPYCISRRLPVWAQLFALREPPGELRKTFLSSFATQARALSQNLEFDLGGNHLLENLRGLTFAGVFFDEKLGNRWLEIAEQQLRQQLPIQILPSGEHYERAPMYHCQVLGNLLQIMYLARSVRDSLSEVCTPFAAKMFDFLDFLIHPDGEIPLFGDSCWGEAHSVEEIHRWAELVNIAQPAEPDQAVTVVDRYWKWRHQRDSLVFDAGPVGADELPAHAHCDLLGFEASIDGQRCFVDSGLFDYEDSLMRAYCRSSAAHNVVTVGYKNSCDIWSRFRMGKRARTVRFEHGQKGDFLWCLASHDGYRHLGITELSRLFLGQTNGTLVCLEYASGAKQPLTGRLHLSPDLEVIRYPSGRILLKVGGSMRWLFFTTDVMLEITDGWYCDRFGNRRPNQVINYRRDIPTTDPLPFGWSLSRSEDTVVNVSSTESNGYQLDVGPPGVSASFSIPFPR